MAKSLYNDMLLLVAVHSYSIRKKEVPPHVVCVECVCVSVFSVVVCVFKFVLCVGVVSVCVDVCVW